jgi:hypothetical protein
MRPDSDFRLCVTLDLDFMDYVSNKELDTELQEAWPALSALLDAGRGRKATWFVRMDDQVAATHGRADYFFHAYSAEINALQRAGHEIGWHPHSYRRSGKQWVQNTDVPSVLQELRKHAPRARELGLVSVRMGWGFQSNEIMKFFSDVGFEVDSSAIPRARYSWEGSQKDWTGAPLIPYRPSQADYRKPGEPAWTLVELPISTAPMRAPYDQEAVDRYFNLAFHPAIFRPALDVWMAEHSHLVTVTHPYELLPGATPHGLLSFNAAAAEENLCAIEANAKRRGKIVRYITASTLSGGTR